MLALIHSEALFGPRDLLTPAHWSVEPGALAGVLLLALLYGAGYRRLR